MKTTREEELRRFADRLRSERDREALSLAYAVRIARRHGVQDLNDRLVADALGNFELVQKHTVLAEELVALEVYGVFWDRVTTEMICGPPAAVEAAS